MEDPIFGSPGEESEMLRTIKRCALQRCMLTGRRYFYELALYAMSTMQSQAELSYDEVQELLTIFREFLIFDETMREAGMK